MHANDIGYHVKPKEKTKNTAKSQRKRISKHASSSKAKVTSFSSAHHGLPASTERMVTRAGCLLPCTDCRQERCSLKKRLHVGPIVQAILLSAIAAAVHLLKAVGGHARVYVAGQAEAKSVEDLTWALRRSD
jgi:hypothetical protein